MDLLASYDAERRPIGERNVRQRPATFRGIAISNDGVEAIEDATAEGDQMRKRVGEQLLRDIGAYVPDYRRAAWLPL